MARFKDRRHAGRALGNALAKYAGRKNAVVLALPRGGVPVGYEVAKALRAPLDVFVVRKLGVPGHAELAMGAIASGGAAVLNDEVIAELAISRAAIDREARSERKELERRQHAYRGDRRPLQAAGKIAILIDDGLATGSTMRAAVAGLRALGPAAIVVGVPVASASVCEQIGSEVDDIVCAVTPEPLFAVGIWYEDFEQTTDHEVRELLARAADEQRHRDAPGTGASP